MIRTSYNDIIVKIFFEGKEIQKVYKQGIQVFPDTGFQKYFWLKVFDEDDQKTYYYNCTQTSVVYQEGSTDVIKEIYYTVGQKQENHPGEDQQIYELLNDQVKITGQEYSENDFESFVDKSPNEVIAMTQTYQEKIITGKTKGIQPDDYVNDNLIAEYDISKVDTVLGYHNQKLSGFSGNIGNFQYIIDWNKAEYRNNNNNKTVGIIRVENTDINDVIIQYIAWGSYSYLSQMFITDSLDDLSTIILGGSWDQFYNMNFKNIITCYGGPDTWKSGFKSNKWQKIIYDLIIPVGKIYYFCMYMDGKADKTADQKEYQFTKCIMSIFFNKDTNLISEGNYINHKYISDITQEKQIGKVKYDFAYAMIKNDLSKKVYQTNCKYIISKEELPGITVNNVLQIPKQSLGWKLLTVDEWKMYSPKDSKYKMMLTVSSYDYTGDEFFGLLDKSNDSTDFRIFGYSDTWIYFDPGNFRTDFEFSKTDADAATTTFVINGKENIFYTWNNGKKIHEWDYSTGNCAGFTRTDTTLYLNAYNSESNLTNEKFYFYEFKIVDSNTGDIVKRIVPSNDRTKLWECVSGKFIEPCRTVSDEANLPVLLDNLKLGVETKDGLGNKIEDWLIY